MSNFDDPDCISARTLTAGTRVPAITGVPPRISPSATTLVSDIPTSGTTEYIHISQRRRSTITRRSERLSRPSDAWLRARGLQAEGRVGHAHARLARTRDIVAMACEQLVRDPLPSCVRRAPDAPSAIARSSPKPGRSWAHRCRAGSAQRRAGISAARTSHGLADRGALPPTIWRPPRARANSNRRSADHREDGATISPRRRPVFSRRP